MADLCHNGIEHLSTIALIHKDENKLYIITKVLLYLNNTITQSINSASEATRHRNGELLYE